MNVQCQIHPKWKQINFILRSEQFSCDKNRLFINFLSSQKKFKKLKQLMKNCQVFLFSKTDFFSLIANVRIYDGQNWCVPDSIQLCRNHNLKARARFFFSFSLEENKNLFVLCSVGGGEPSTAFYYRFHRFSSQQKQKTLTQRWEFSPEALCRCN